MNDLISKLLSNKKILIITLFVLGVLFILISFYTPKSKTTSETVVDYEMNYILNLEERIEKILSGISQVGDCDVMINYLSTCESVYVQESKKSYNNQENNVKSESETSILTTKDQKGNQVAVERKKLMPQISGVIVTINSPKNAKIESDIISAVSTALNIGSNSVCVISK